MFALEPGSAAARKAIAGSEAVIVLPAWHIGPRCLFGGSIFVTVDRGRKWSSGRQPVSQLQRQ